MSSTFDNVGPMARTVEDCALMLRVISGQDPLDVTSLDVPVPDFSAGLDSGVNGMRLGVERDYFFARATDDVGRAIDDALELFATRGAEIVDLHIPELELAVPTAMPPILADTTAFHRRWIRERADRYEASTRVMIELGEIIPATHYVRAQRARRVLRDRIRASFEMFRLDAMVAPTLPQPTVPVQDLNLVLNDASGESPGSGYFRQCVVANVIGIPALSAPAGFSSDGLPIGLALFGRPLAERTLFQIARAYESQHDWNRRVPDLRRPVVAAG
jgi:aspartyl-tRNA(Asn)/glutamyl-tRNA(Gln) amidotransferase subunit A